MKPFAIKRSFAQFNTLKWFAARESESSAMTESGCGKYIKTHNHQPLISIAIFWHSCATTSEHFSMLLKQKWFKALVVPICLIHTFIWLYCMVPLYNVFGSQVGHEGTYCIIKSCSVSGGKSPLLITSTFLISLQYLCHSALLWDKNLRHFALVETRVTLH